MRTQLTTGERIGDWVIVEPLGSGGMGSVYRAHNSLTTQVQAAIKVLTVGQAESARERFVREIEVLASLDHPTIVRVLGGGMDANSGALFLAMELVKGRDLTWYIAERAMPWTDACRVAHDVAEALTVAHARGVHHRDLKPANIMLGDGGTVKLIDFGIALADGQTRLTQDRGVPGTMAYMPPELFARGRPDPALGDIYSLGVVLFEMLTGRRAYPEDPDLTTVQRYAAVMGAKVQDPHLDPGEAVPESVRELVKAATHADPGRRIPDARTLADALAALLEDQPGGKLSTPAPTPPRPKSTEETFALGTLDPAADAPAAQPAAKRSVRTRRTDPKSVPHHRQPLGSPGLFPGISLSISAATALGPPAWTLFWFVAMAFSPDIGGLVFVMTLLFAPLWLPPIAVTGIATTGWFSIRVFRRRGRLVWWSAAVFLMGLHMWHLFLAVANTALLAAALQMTPPETASSPWRDLIPGQRAEIRR